ncbi:MAG: DUF2282 domain-containing protein [Bradymonadia bacterium]
MTKEMTLMVGGLVSMVGLGVACADKPQAAAEETITVIKCLGVAKAGHNDCGSTDGRHDCSGKAAKDLDPTEWVYVPEGPLCEKWGGKKMVKAGKVVSKQKPVAKFLAR